jgi:phage terminase large subunit
MATFKISEDGNTGIMHTTYQDNKFIDSDYRRLLENLINEDEYFHTVYALGEWSALKLSGRIYKRFSDKNIISYKFNPEAVINVCCDFNYDPMKWALIQQENGEDIVFDEIVQNDTETELMAKELLQRYPMGVFEIYGDYSGLSRSTRRRSTDYDIMREVLKVKQDKIFVKPNPIVTTRTNIVNWRLCNKMGIRKLFVDAKCEHAVKDFRRVTWLKNKKVEDQTDPNNELTHISSAIGYYINYKYTLKELIPGKVTRVA